MVGTTFLLHNKLSKFTAKSNTGVFCVLQFNQLSSQKVHIERTWWYCNVSLQGLGEKLEQMVALQCILSMQHHHPEQMLWSMGVSRTYAAKSQQSS